MADPMPLSDALIAELLAPSDPVERLERLRRHSLDNEAGLTAVIEVAGRLMVEDLARARQLLDLAVAAAALSAPEVEPQALYLRAQALAMNGDFAAALAEIGRARVGFAATGQTAAALRTYVGEMHVLVHQGRYGEALSVADTALAALAGQTALPADAVARLQALIGQNRGNCFKYMGRYDEALAAFAEAEARFRSLPGHEDDAATLTMNRGVVLAELGRAHEALTAYEEALAVFERTDNRLRQAQAWENLGEVYLWLGRGQQSLDAFRRARALFETLGASVELYILERLTADAYLALNLWPEAIAAYREAIAGLRASGMDYDLGWALWGVGAALIRRLELREAEQVLEEAAAIFAASGNEHLRTSVLLEQAALAEAQQRHDLALARVQQALALIGNNDWPVPRVHAHLRLADLLLPDLAAAEAVLREAERLVETLPLPHLRIGVWQRLGHVARLRGRAEEAETYLLRAVEQIEAQRGNLAQQALRASFLHDKIAAYEDLIRLYLDRGDRAGLEKAFDLAERARSRTLVDLLAGLMAERPAETVGADLEQRLESLRTELNAIYNETLRQGTVGDRGPRLLELQRRAAALAESIGHLRLQTGRDALLTGTAPTLSLAEIATALAPDQCLIAYHGVEDEVIAFVCRHDGLRVFRHLAPAKTVDRLLWLLESEYQRFQADADFVRRHMPRLVRSIQQVLYELHTSLLAPMADLLAEGDHLIVVPHGPLHHLSFAALYDGRRYLVEKARLSMVPSATALVLGRRRRPKPLRRAVLVGVADPSIPWAEREVHAISRYLPNPQVLVGEQATVEALRRQGAEGDLLHVACHGLFRSDNPFFSALKLHDGWLTAHDILQLRFDAPLVTLSACESGRSQVAGGDELLGLPHAFLGAGAAALLVSLWLVEDKTTALFMNSFYHSLAEGHGYADSLRRAQLATMADYPHPYYWAPFVLIGAD